MMGVNILQQWLWTHASLADPQSEEVLDWKAVGLASVDDGYCRNPALMTVAFLAIGTSTYSDVLRKPRPD